LGQQRLNLGPSARADRTKRKYNTGLNHQHGQVYSRRQFAQTNTVISPAARLSGLDPTSRIRPLRIPHCNCPPAEAGSYPPAEQTLRTSKATAALERTTSTRGGSQDLEKQVNLWNFSGHVCRRTAEDQSDRCAERRGQQRRALAVSQHN
jgi:hypothetical protein